MRGLVALLLAVLSAPTLLPAIAAQAQDDAGSGADAPNHHASALLVPLGLHVGRLEPGSGDSEDWYYVELSPGKALYATLRPSNGTSLLRLAHAQGWAVEENRSEEGAETRAAARVLSSGIVKIGILRSSGSGSYELLLESQDTTDIHIDEFVIGPEPEPADASDPRCRLRTISMTITNRGGPDYRSMFLIWTEHTFGSSRTIASGEPFFLEANQTATYTFLWDTTGEVGDVELHAEAYSYMDPRREDNKVTTTVTVLAPGPAGLSASPPASPGGNPACPYQPW